MDAGGDQKVGRNLLGDVSPSPWEQEEREEPESAGHAALEGGRERTPSYGPPASHGVCSRSLFHFTY